MGHPVKYINRWYVQIHIWTKKYASTWCVFAGVGFLTPAEHIGRGEVLHRAELGAEPGLELLRPRPALHVDRLPPRGRGGRPIRAVTLAHTEIMYCLSHFHCK